MRIVALVVALLAQGVLCAQGLQSTTININDVAPGSITWIDTSSYPKPAYIPVALPTIVTNYYVNMDGGSDTDTCGLTTGSPCATVRALACGTCGSTYRGLTGLRGNSADGAAAINVRGTGPLYTNCVSGGDHGIQGTPGKEIVIKPWAGFTATFHNSEAPGIHQGLNGNPSCLHDIIIYGKDSNGAMALKFETNDSSCGGGGPCWGLAIMASNVVVAYTEFTATSSTSANSWVDLVGVCNSNGLTCNNIQFINDEFHDCATGSNQCSAVYTGPCDASGSCTVNGFVFKNNIVRNMGGEGIEINPRLTSTGNVITGNVFRHLGFLTCNDGGVRFCRPAITINNNQSGSVNGIVIANNYMSDIASGCIWENSKATGANAPLVENNTCYDYGKGTIQNAKPQGIQAVGDTSQAIVQNNIFVAPNGTAGIGANMNGTESFNLCTSIDSSCGASKQTYSASTFLSITNTDSNYLKIGSSSEAATTGTDLRATVPTDYFGTTRTVPVSIGAMEAP